MNKGVASCLKYFSKQSDYAIIDGNAALVYIGWINDLKTPFKILTSNKISHQGIVDVKESPLETLSREVIIKNSQELNVSLKGNNYAIRVARPEHLVALDLASGQHYGRDAFRIIKSRDINFEEVRAILKGLDNYDELYTKLTRAYYELSIA